MERIVRYCVDCGWRIHDDEREEPSASMIEHAIETGHDVESRLETDGERSLRPTADRSSATSFRDRSGRETSG